MDIIDKRRAAGACQKAFFGEFLRLIIRNDVRTERRFNHTLQGHMCIDTTIEALRANDLSRVNNIILLHLSAEHADPERFQAMVQQATGKTVYVAKPGLEIEFNKTPF